MEAVGFTLVLYENVQGFNVQRLNKSTLYSKQKDCKLQTQTDKGLIITPGLKLTNARSFRSRWSE